MGESAFLVRSISHPADTFREVGEGEPIRVLKESVSFGRFMSESLDWERWSTFSHNRYLEEVEKLSKPGIVAQRKAYFEAHYEKRAALKKKATAVLEVEPTATNYVPEIETAREIEKDFSVDTNSGKVNVIIIEQPLDVISDSEMAYSADANTCQLSTETETITMVEGGDPIVEKNVHMESSSLLENSELLGKADNHEYVACPPEEMADNVNFTSSRKGEEAKSLLKSLVHGGGSGQAVSHCRKPRQSDFMQARNRNNVILNGKTLPRNLNDTRTSMSKSLHMSINPCYAAETSKALPSIPKDSLAPLQPTSVHVRNIYNNIPNMKLSSGGSKTKKRLIPNSLHMSFNFGPHTGDVNKTSCKVSKTSSTTVLMTSARARDENDIHPKSKIFSGYSNRKKRSKPNVLDMSIIASQACKTSEISPRMPKDESNPAPISAKASVSMIPKHPLKNLHAEAKRTSKTNIPLNKSMSGGITTDRKFHLSVDHAKPLNSIRAKAQSTRFSPFIFKSEERAAKRKEFFKMLEEKNNGKEVEREQQRPRRLKHM